MYQLSNSIYAENKKMCRVISNLMTSGTGNGKMKLHKNRGAVQQLIHSNKMTHAASQYEAMKNFMRTEVLMKTVKYRKFAGVNYTADGVDDSTCQQPEKGTPVE